jgi:hypothetical protein
MAKVKINGLIEDIKDYVRIRKINATDSIVELKDGSELLLITKQMEKEEIKLQETLQKEVSEQESNSNPLHDWLSGRHVMLEELVDNWKSK